MTPRPRRTPRQAAIVTVGSPHDAGAAPLSRAFGGVRLGTLLGAALLDVLGALVRVDGVTLTVLAANRAATAIMIDRLPAGIDLLAPDEDGQASQALLARAIDLHLDRAFERVIVIAGDVVGLTPRLASTALSALGSADLVLGASPTGRPYLVGVRAGVGVGLGGRAAVDLLGGSGMALDGMAAGLLERGAAAGLVIRRLVRLPRLSELTLDAAVPAELSPETSPRLVAALAAPTSGIAG